MSTTPTFPLRTRGVALAALAVAVAGALTSTDAAASGFQISENTAQALGRAYAGRDTAGNDVSVVENNPAAMSDLTGNMFQVDVTGIGVNTQFHGSGSDAFGAPLSGGDGGNGGDVTPVPALAAMFQLNDAWRIGFAMDAPFGLKTEYDNGWVGRYQALKSKVTSLDLTGSVSWTINPQFALGASLIAQRTKVDLSNAVDFGALIAATQLAECGGEPDAVGCAETKAEVGRLGVQFEYADPAKYFRWNGDLKTKHGLFEADLGAGPVSLSAAVSLLAPEVALSEAMFF